MSLTKYDAVLAVGNIKASASEVVGLNRLLEFAQRFRDEGHEEDLAAMCTTTSAKKLYEGPDTKLPLDKKPLATIAIVHEILQQAKDEVGSRATTYDTPQGEESMPKVVEMFNLLYGYNLTIEHGWMFMALLKVVRSSQGKRKLDNYVDLAAYAAFAGKAAME